MNISANNMYGGWFSPQVKTGNNLSTVVKTVRTFGFVYCTLIASIVGVQTGSDIASGALSERSSQVRANVVFARSPQENLKHIKNVFSPSIQDLANTFNVSRQSVYNWMNGETVADDNLVKLIDLAEAADIFESANIKVSPMILKGRLVDGKNIFQIVREGGSAKYAATRIVETQQRTEAQRSTLIERFKSKKGASPTADFVLPAPNELV